jgi:hypothetical protein
MLWIALFYAMEPRVIKIYKEPRAFFSISLLSLTLFNCLAWYFGRTFFFLPIRLLGPINQHPLGTPRLWMTKQQGPSINKSGQANSQQGAVDLMEQTD